MCVFSSLIYVTSLYLRTNINIVIFPCKQAKLIQCHHMQIFNPYLMWITRYLAGTLFCIKTTKINQDGSGATEENDTYVSRGRFNRI